MQEVLEAADLHVKSVAFDTVKIQDKRVAYVRLQPPPLPWEITDKQDTDVSKIAIAVVKCLKEADPPLQLGDDKLQFDTSHPQVQLFIGNITEEWSDDVSLRNKMEEYGPVERCLVMHSHKGQNKVQQTALHCQAGGRLCHVVLSFGNNTSTCNFLSFRYCQVLHLLLFCYSVDFL